MTILNSKESMEFRKIMIRVRELIIANKTMEEIYSFETSNDCKLRTHELDIFNKDKLNRYLKAINQTVLDLNQDYKLNIIEKLEYNQELMTLQTMLLSIIDYAKNHEWKISKNWIIQ